MDEKTQLFLWFAKIIVVVISALLYRLGGWKNKAYRRFAMPIFYCLCCSVIAILKHSFSYFFIVAMVLEVAALCKGYGKHGDKLINKIKLRAIAGVLVAIAALPYFIPSKAYSIFALHFIFCVSASILLGSFNQTAEGAASEEANIGIAYKLLPIMVI